MTIAPLEPTDALDDAELAMDAARGDRAAFAAIYDRYADRLYDFCAGMLRDGDAAADCVQDVFVDAATQLGTLRDPSRLRSWLYAIARHQALARIKARRREMPSDELPELDSGDPDMATVAARKELAALIAEACGALSERDRTVFELTYRHGLDGGELAKALGVSHTNANTLAGRLRDGVERSLGALLVCRGVKADPTSCPELAAIVEDWDGTFTVLVRKRAARHIEGCVVCDAERRRRVNPVALLGGMPVFLPAPAYLREHTLTAASTKLPEPEPATGARGSASALRAALVVVFALLGIAGVLQVASPLRAQDYRVEPVTELDDVTSDLPGTVTALTAPSSAPPSPPPTTRPSEPSPVTTAITNAPTVATEPTPSATRTPSAPTTRPNSSFSPSRNPESSAMRTTQSSTRTSTPTSSSTATSTSPSTPPSSSPTTTTSDPIE
jgi:RNA polymerase sigma factor (sigma-70 family)